MGTRPLALCLWIALWLVALEAALELRAWRRGYETLLFPRQVLATPADPAARDAAYGPTPEFPFRSLVVPRERAPGVRRIWVASASHAQDEVYHAAVIFPSRLAEHLHERGIDAQVLNASRAGWTIAHNVRDLTDGADAWKPDVALLYQMSLDVNELSARFLSGAPSRADVAPEAAGGEPVLDAPGPSWPVRLVESTTIFSILKSTFTSRLARQRLLATRLPDEARALFLANVERFVATARAHGVEPVLCTFAARHGRADADGFSPEALMSIFRYNQYLSPRAWTEIIDDWNAALRALAARDGLRLVDLGAALGGKAALYRDFVHFTPEGHDRAGALLAEALAR